MNYSFNDERDHIQRFFDGDAIRAYEFFGSHVENWDGRQGVVFRVWAPNALSVSVVGDFNGWNQDLWMESDGNYLVYKGFTINDDYTEDNTDPLEFKFRKDAGWNWNYGAAFKGKHETGVAYEPWRDGENIVLPDKGTYDIYLSKYLNKYYIMPQGEKPSDYVGDEN